MRLSDDHIHVCRRLRDFDCLQFHLIRSHAIARRDSIDSIPQPALDSVVAIRYRDPPQFVTATRVDS
jgi:hypothetical protein